MADFNYQEPSKDFAFAYNHEAQDTKWASRVQDNTLTNNNTTEQTQQNKFLKPNDDKFEKKLEDFKQNYLPKPYGGLEWHEFKDKYAIKTNNDKGEEISIVQKEFDEKFKNDIHRNYIYIKYPYIPNLIRKDNFDSYETLITNPKFSKLLKTGIFNAITAREALKAYMALDALHPAYVAVWFHNHPIEGELLISNLPVEFQRLPKVSLVRGFQEKQIEPTTIKKIDEKTGETTEEKNYDVTPKNNVEILINTIKKELILNKADTNMLYLLADIVVEAGIEYEVSDGLKDEANKDKFLTLLEKTESEGSLAGSDKESNFLKGQELTEDKDSTVTGLTVGGIGAVAAIGIASWPIIAILAGVGLAGFGLHKLGVPLGKTLGVPLGKALARPFLRKRSLAKLQKRVLGLSTLGGSLMGLELSEKMSNPKDETSKEEYKAWLMAQNLEQGKPESRNNRKFQENITKLENGDVSIYFDRQLKEFKLAAMALPIAQTSTLFWDMSVRSKAGFFKHVYLKTTLGENGKNSLLDLYVGDVLMENLRFIFPESTFGMGRLKAKNLHIQLRHQDLTNTTNLNSLIQGAIFMLMYRMMSDTGQIKASADLLHKALGQNIHEGMTLDANAQYIGIENFYGTDLGKIGKIELGGDSPEDNTHISVTTKTNPEQAQDQNVPNKKFLAEKKEELLKLQNELQSKKGGEAKTSKSIRKLERKIKALEQKIVQPEQEVLDSELKSQVNVSLTTNKLRFEEADMISSMVAKIAKAKLEEVGMKFENLKGLENFRVNGLKLGSNMSPQAITDLFFSSSEIIFDILEADKFAYTLKDETKKDDKGKPLSTPTMSIKGGKTKMEGTKLDFYMKYPDYKVGEKFNEDDLPFDKLQIKKLHIPLSSIEDFHVVDEQSHVELTRLNGLSFIRDITIGAELDAKGLESFSLKVGQIDQQNKEQKNQTHNNFAFKTNDMDLNGKYILNGISGIDYKLTTNQAPYLDLKGEQQTKRLMNHTFKLGSLSLGKSELSSFNMGKPSDSFFVSSKKGETVSLEGIEVKGFEVAMEECFMSAEEQKKEAEAKKEEYKYDPSKTKTYKYIELRELNIDKVKGGNLKVNINNVDEKTKKATPSLSIDLGKDGFLESVKISGVRYDEKMGDDFLTRLIGGNLEINAFKAPTMFFGLLGKLHKTQTGLISLKRFYNGTSADQRGAYFTIKDFKSKFDQSKDKEGNLLDVSTGADLDGMIYDNGRFILNSDSRFTIPKLNWKSGADEIYSRSPAGIEGITVDILPIRDNSPERKITHFQINDLLFKKTYLKDFYMKKGGLKIELPKQYQTIIPNIWLKGILDKKTLNYVGKGGLQNGFDWNEIKISVNTSMYQFFRTNVALQAEKLDFESGADGSFELVIEKLKSGLNKNSSNENSVYLNGLSLNTPLENSLVADPNKPNQASLFDADKVIYKITPDKKTPDKKGNPMMRKKIIMENPKLNFLPLKGNIYAKNSLGKPSGLSAIQLQDLLLSGKTKGNLIAEQTKIDLGNDYYGGKDSNIAIKQARGEEEVWRITAEGGEFELDNLNANVHNMETLSEMFSDKEKPEKKKEPSKKEDFAFLDGLDGSSVIVTIYGKDVKLPFERLNKKVINQNFQNSDEETENVYLDITTFWVYFKSTFLSNIGKRYSEALGTMGLPIFKLMESLVESNLDLIELTLEDSFQKNAFIKTPSNTYMKLSALASFLTGDINLNYEVIKEMFFIKVKNLFRIDEETIDRKLFKKLSNEKKEEELNTEEIIKNLKEKPSLKDFGKLYKSLEKDAENKADQNEKTPLPTLKELKINYEIAKSIFTQNPNTANTTLLLSTGWDFLWEKFLHILFTEFSEMNPSISIYMNYKKDSQIQKNNAFDMERSAALLKIGQNVDKIDQSFKYGKGDKDVYEFYDFIHHPTINLRNLVISHLNLPVKSDQVIPNTHGKETYSVTDQIIKINRLNLESLQLSHVSGWGYNDFRNGRVGDILQKSKIQAWGSGAKISGFEMILRQPNDKDTETKK